MMDRSVIYKVLWVDDEDAIVLGTKQDADVYGIELDRYSNWQDAEVALRAKFEDYSAIILDANCKLSQDKNITGTFINVVLRAISQISGEKQKFIPWYILSAGTAENFSFTISGAEESHNTKEWGQMWYKKDVPEDDSRNSKYLYENIIRVAKGQTNNVVLFRHKDVFEYLGEGKLIDERARIIMLKMLCALYYPEENIGYKYEGNPLRKVMEYIFRSANKIGLLPQECIERDDNINLLESNRYMSGLNTTYSHLRYGEPGTGNEGKGGDTIFPEIIGYMTKSIIAFGSVESHTTNKINPYTINDKDYTLTEKEKELFFGYVLQLCHIIKWFGNYAGEHSNIEENRKMQRVVVVVTEDNGEKQVDLESARKRYENEEVVPTCDNGIWHYKECCVSVKYWTEGNKMVITEVSLNTNKQTKSEYPYFAKYKILKSNFCKNE